MAEEKKITANDTISLMLNAINSDRKDQFYSIAESYMNTLSKSGDWYYKISRILREKPMTMKRLDEMSNDIKKLVSYAPVEDVDAFLSDDLKSLIQDLLIEWLNPEAFRYHNLGTRNKILLHGPTGNGKTTIAKYISTLVKLPFVEVNADIMIDSHIGSTGGNIHKLFKNIQQPCVLFWDEIDSIGYKRGRTDGSAAGMENDRMVNSILVNFEKMHPDVIFVAATNRMDILDPAFMRRFHEIVEVKSPTEEEKILYISKLYDYYKLPFQSESSVKMAELASYSDIKRLFLSEARKYVASKLITQTPEK